MTLKQYAWLALCLVGLSAPAFGDTFQDRVTMAKAAEANPVYSTWESAMMAEMGRTLSDPMMHCFRSIKNPSTAPFTVVASLLPNGTATQIEARPQTTISACVAAAIGAYHFIPPPEYPGHRAFPIVFEMNIKP